MNLSYPSFQRLEARFNLGNHPFCNGPIRDQVSSFRLSQGVDQRFGILFIPKYARNIAQKHQLLRSERLGDSRGSGIRIDVELLPFRGHTH